jgi:hypothetical protein
VIPATFTAVRVANITIWEHIQMGWSSSFLIFYLSYLFFNLVELPWQQYTVSMYVQENLLLLKS